MTEKSSAYLDGYNDFWNEKQLNPPASDDMTDYLDGYFDAMDEVIYSHNRKTSDV